MNTTARRNAQIDIRRSVALIVTVAAFLLGLLAGRAAVEPQVTASPAAPTADRQVWDAEVEADLSTDEPTPDSEVLDVDPAPVECDPATPGCEFEADGQQFVTDADGIAVPQPEVIMEDDPRFDCRTMGNLNCGVQVHGVWYLIHFDSAGNPIDVTVRDPQ